MAGASRRKLGKVDKRVQASPPDEARATRKAVENLPGFVDFALGDPRLSVWEANFVNSMGLLAQAEWPTLTERQLAVVEQISEKLGFGRPARVPMPDEAEEFEVVDSGAPLDLLDGDDRHRPQEPVDGVAVWRP